MLVVVLLALKQTLQSSNAHRSVRELIDTSLLAVEWTWTREGGVVVYLAKATLQDV